MRKPVGFESRVQRTMYHGLKACNKEGVFATDVTRAMRNASEDVRLEAKQRMMENHLVMVRPANNPVGRPAREIHTTKRGREVLADLELVFGNSHRSVWG